MDNDSPTGGPGNDTFNVDAGSLSTVTDSGCLDALVVRGANATQPDDSVCRATIRTSTQAQRDPQCAGRRLTITLTDAGGPNGHTVNGARATASQAQPCRQLSAARQRHPQTTANDSFIGGTGSDSIVGGAGVDTVAAYNLATMS
jgi:Ca2+-binding RTX toxin-like protein